MQNIFLFFFLYLNIFLTRSVFLIELVGIQKQLRRSIQDISYRLSGGVKALVIIVVAEVVIGRKGRKEQKINFQKILNY